MKVLELFALGYSALCGITNTDLTDDVDFGRHATRRSWFRCFDLLEELRADPVERIIVLRPEDLCNECA